MPTPVVPRTSASPSSSMAPLKDPRPGTLVKLAGLESAAGRKLNGKHAFVTKGTQTTTSAGRASVLPLPYRRGAKPVALKLAALTPVVHIDAQPVELRASYASAVRSHSAALLRDDRAVIAVAQLDMLLSSGALSADPTDKTSDAESGDEDADVDSGTGAADGALTARVEILALRAYALRGAERYTEAISAMKSLLAKPGVPPAVRARAQCELALTRIEDGGDVSAAMDVVERMVAELNSSAANEGTDGAESDQMDSGSEEEGESDEDDEDRDEEEDEEEHGVSLVGAIARAADEALHIAQHGDDDDLIVRGAEALLRVRPKNIDALRALGQVLTRRDEKGRGEELIKQADALEAAADAEIPPEGALARLSGMPKRALNGRYAVVSALEVEPDAADEDVLNVGVVLLPFDEKNGVTCAAPDNLEIIEPPCSNWPAGMVDMYIDGVAEAAGMSLEYGTGADEYGAEENVGVAQDMCARAISVVQGVDTPETMPKLLYVHWLAHRAGGDEDGAKSVRADVEAIGTEHSAAILCEMERVIEEDGNAREAGRGSQASDE